MIFDGRQLRNAMGRFATGVCLITIYTDDRRPLALTANSFSSVSLDPPLALWSLQNNSDVYADYASQRAFAINVLADEQQAMSNQYARKGQHELDPAHFREGSCGAPVIRNALVNLECEMYATYEAGDHLIILGQIHNMHERPHGKPLLFYAGGYGELR